MDEICQHQKAHIRELKANENRLLKRRQLVFTGGDSLYEANSTSTKILTHPPAESRKNICDSAGIFHK